MTDIKERREAIKATIKQAVLDHERDIYTASGAGALVRITDENTQRLFSKLSSLGLVFKVEGELPEITWINSYHQRGSTINGYATMDVSTRTENAHEYRTRIAQAGYTKTEPLEEK